MIIGNSICSLFKGFDNQVMKNIFGQDFSCNLFWHVVNEKKFNYRCKCRLGRFFGFQMKVGTKGFERMFRSSKYKVLRTKFRVHVWTRRSQRVGPKGLE